MTTDPLATTPPAAPLPSRTIARRALTLPVGRPVGISSGAYIVGSGSTPGVTYNVIEFMDGHMQCDCIGGQSGHDCSHVWAARAHSDPATRRALLAIVRPARRMSEAAARRLAEDFAQAAIWLDAESAFVEDDRSPVVAKRYVKFMDRLVARLTGHAADDDEGGPR